MFELARTSKMVWRLGALVMMGAALSACSSVPDWVDPTTWIGSSDSQTASSDSQSTADQGTTSAAGSQGQTVAEASDQYPALADTPGKAPPSSSTDERRQVAGALVADRTQAQYSAEALRGGTEPAAPPPGAAVAETESLPPPSENTPAAASSSDRVASDTSVNSAAAQTAAAAPSGPPPMPGTLPSETPAPVAPAQTRVASVAPSVATAPMPPPPSARAAAPQIAATDAALGFQPSHAPPLDPQFGSPNIRHQRMAAVNPTAATMPSVSAPNGTPAAVVSFAQSTATLDDAARAQVRTAVQAYRAAGGRGYIRVVGHAPGGGGSEQQMLSAFSGSQACADAVARELVKQGVPAGRVLVDAVGDAAGNAGRRAEIFLQS